VGVANRLAIFLLCVIIVLVGPATAARADSATRLPFPNGSGAWLTVDPAGQHVFVSGGPGNSSIVVLNYAGTIVKTIPNQAGASQMALDSYTHTLYAALHDATAISEINTQTLTETKRFSTAPYPDPSSLVIAGGKLWFSCFQGDGENCHGLVSANLDGTGMAPAPAPIASYFFATALAAGGPGNKYLAVGDSYQEPPDVDVYDVSGTTPTVVSHVHNPDGGSAQIRDMTFDPTGANLLLACGAPYYIESLTTSNLLSSGQYPTGAYPDAVAVSRNGKYVAGGIDSNAGPDVFVYAAGNTTPVRTWQLDSQTGNDLLIHSLAFSPDVSRLFAIANDSVTGHLAFHVLLRPTVRLAPTRTSLRRSTSTVHYGEHVKLKVHVKGTRRGKVDLYATDDTNIPKHLVSRRLRSGSVTFTIKPKRNLVYSAQLEEGPGYASSASKALPIWVVPVLSVVTYPDGAEHVQGHRVSRTGLIAHVRPGLPSFEVLEFDVQQRENGAWVASATNQFEIGHGTVRADFFTTKPGLSRVQVVYRGDSSYRATKSAWTVFQAR
jgi:hypothetical protein